MPYIITASVTFSSQANRDAALARVNTALSAYSYTNVATALSAGIQTPTTTTLTISIQDGDDGATVAAIQSSLMTALTSSNRHTLGYVSVNKV